jgi:hypothetical protein
MNEVERAVPTPPIKIIMQGRSWLQIFRDRPPLAARAQHAYQTIDDLAQIINCPHPTWPAECGARTLLQKHSSGGERLDLHGAAQIGQR